MTGPRVVELGWRRREVHVDGKRLNLAPGNRILYLAERFGWGQAAHENERRLLALALVYREAEHAWAPRALAVQAATHLHRTLQRQMVDLLPSEDGAWQIDVHGWMHAALLAENPEWLNHHAYLRCQLHRWYDGRHPNGAGPDPADLSETLITTTRREHR